MYIKAHVFPDSKNESAKREGDSLLVIHVKEPAEANRANKRVLEIVRGMFPGKTVRLVSGHQSPHKIVSIGE